MKATVKLVLLTAVRDRLFGGLFGLIALSTALSVFLGGTSLTEQLNAAIVFAAGSGRLILVFGLTIFAAFHIQALFETREVEAILTRPISRGQFVLAYWFGFACLAVALAGVFGAVIVFAAGGTLGAFLWAATLIAECLIMLGVVLFAGLMLERATTTVLFVLGFYGLARLMGFFVGIRETVDQTPVNAIVTRLLDFVLLFIPRLDLFAHTQWLMYKPEHADYSFLIIQSILFLMLVLGAAAFDLRRKQF
jgi:hypothetical protein